MLTLMGFGQTFLTGVRHGFMPPQLKTKITVILILIGARISVIQWCNGEKLKPLNLICSLLLYCRGVVPGCARGAFTPPDFDISVNLISIREENHDHLITMGTLGFSDLPTALYCAVYACILLYCMY